MKHLESMTQKSLSAFRNLLQLNEQNQLGLRTKAVSMTAKHTG